MLKKKLIGELSWMEKAKGELGQYEVRGGENPRILEYAAATTLHAAEDEVPWCAAFVSWCLPDGGLHSARARDYLNYGAAIGFPKYGCLVIFDRGHGLGHVGFFLGEVGERYMILGGNQGDEVCVKDYDPTKIIGYRWPDLKPTTGDAE